MAAPIVVDPAPGEDGFIEETAVAGQPKYLALHVPNFSGSLHSYLCLGADTQWRADSQAAGQQTSAYGDTLANLVAGFADDDRPRGDRSLPVQGPAESRDDTGTGTKPIRHGKRESELLHAKGGWRDHSDGNRITTTFGDKVEVVRGNYKLLVLGRQDVPGTQVAGWDISGGLVSTDTAALNYPAGTPAFGSDGVVPEYGGQQLLSTQYTWIQDFDGNWGWRMVTETGAYAPTPQQGNAQVLEYRWVDMHRSLLGGPDPAQTDPNAPNPPRPAKVIDERRWGETIIRELHAMQATTPPTSGPASVAGFTPATPSLTTTISSDGLLTSTTTVGGVMAETITAANYASLRTVSGQSGYENDVSGGQTIVESVKGGQTVTNTYGTWGSSVMWESLGLAVANIAATVGLSMLAGKIFPDQVGQAADTTDAVDGDNSIVTVNQPPGGNELPDAPTGVTTPPAGYDTGVPTTASYLSSPAGWGKDIADAVGKLGPTIVGMLESPTKALDETTTVYGPASHTSWTWGTKSTTDYAFLGTLTTMELCGLTNTKTTVTGLMNTELKIAGAMSSSIKLSLLGNTEFDISIRGVNTTIFGATAIHNDLAARVINQAPSLVLNAVSAFTNIVEWGHVSVDKTHLASMHSAMGLLHLLF